MGAKIAFYCAVVVGVVSKVLLALPLWQSGVLFILGFLGLGGLRPTYLFFKNLPRDLYYLKVFGKTVSSIQKSAKNNETVPGNFKDVVSKYPNKTAILFEDKKWTFKELESYSNKVSNLLIQCDFKQGDCIALMMTNCPEYVGVLLGASRIGVEVALINHNLRDKGLHHCIKIAECSGIVFEDTLEEAISNIYSEFDERTQSMCFCLGDPISTGLSFDTALKEQPDTEPAHPLQALKHEDVFCYIYTSGTTGLPKAVPIKHRRAFSMVKVFQYTVPILLDDVLYTALPLYHSNGCMLSMGQCFTRGVTVALRKKFSASRFITDCIKYKCTVFCYIGEVCRYILLQPPADTDTQHSIVKCFGNGLRPDIWQEFQKRFAIPKIMEFYGSTEGNCAFFNVIGKQGAIGYVPAWLSAVTKQYFIKIDPTTGEIVRDKNGFCIEISPGEKGEIIRAFSMTDPANRFDGYKDKQATSKKVLTDVFKKGDYYFRSGDIARVDEDGYVYFCDRAGDTFRWKGENVSTTEVENIINSCIGQTDVVVYGVEIPNTDGRAGMASIVGTPESIGIVQLADQLKKALPSYAVPIFIRVIVDNFRITGTFKFQKVDYRKEGFDLDKVSGDQLFVLDPSSKKEYVPLTRETYSKICNGEIKV